MSTPKIKAYLYCVTMPDGLSWYAVTSDLDAVVDYLVDGKGGGLQLDGEYSFEQLKSYYGATLTEFEVSVLEV